MSSEPSRRHSVRMARSCDPVSTRTFHLLSASTPEEIWGALTCPVRSERFLHGMRVDGCWSTDGVLTFSSSHGFTLSGRVLFSAPPYTLSMTIEDEASGTCTYLTWSLRASEAGTIVRLRVDEPDAGPAAEEELEDVWLPALAALDAVLQPGPQLG